MTNTTTTTNQICQTEWTKNKRKWRCLRLAGRPDKRVFVITANKYDRAQGDAPYTIRDDAEFLGTAKTLASARRLAVDYLTIN